MPRTYSISAVQSDSPRKSKKHDFRIVLEKGDWNAFFHILLYESWVQNHTKSILPSSNFVSFSLFTQAQLDHVCQTRQDSTWRHPNLHGQLLPGCSQSNLQYTQPSARRCLHRHARQDGKRCWRCVQLSAKYANRCTTWQLKCQYANVRAMI